MKKDVKHFCFFFFISFSVRFFLFWLFVLIKLVSKSVPVPVPVPIPWPGQAPHFPLPLSSGLTLFVFQDNSAWEKFPPIISSGRACKYSPIFHWRVIPNIRPSAGFLPLETFLHEGMTLLLTHYKHNRNLPPWRHFLEFSRTHRAHTSHRTDHRRRGGWCPMGSCAGKRYHDLGRKYREREGHYTWLLIKWMYFVGGPDK